MTMLEQNAKEKKVLMVIASYGFRDEEYQKPRQVLEQNGIDVLVGSSTLETARGMLGTMVAPDVVMDQVKTNDYAGLIFVGGSGATEYFDSKTAQNAAKNMLAARKPLGAICIAPMILANAGLLKGKKFTAFSTVIKKIEGQGGIYQDSSTVQDGLILTADGPKSAQQFGQAFVDMLRRA